MSTEIKTWQIVDGELQPISTNLGKAGRTEPYDLEPWIESKPTIVGARREIGFISSRKSDIGCIPRYWVSSPEDAMAGV